MTQFQDGQDQDHAGPEREIRQTDDPAARGPQGLARWYWGTAGLLMVAAMSVSVIPDRQHDVTSPSEQEVATGPIEDSAAWVEAAMKEAEGRAMSILSMIDPELDAAFKPVYAGIPRYMDFHYSLKGEWLELSAGVLGQMENQLDQRLFAGLDSRIATISQGLQSDFVRIWVSSVEDSLADRQEVGGPVAQLATRSLADARDRVKSSAVVFGGLGAGAAALSIVPRVIARKLGQSIAGKVAAKTGARWITALGSAGTGAILCSWAGPGAAACAAAGAVISWVGVDYAMIKLDEHVSRDDFERELHALVDEQKAAIRSVLEGILIDRLLGAQAERKVAVMTISLAELPDYDRRMACEAVEEISKPYFSLIDNLNDRSPAKVDALSDLLAQHRSNRLLAPWVDRIESDISNADLNIRLDGGMKIKVQVPPELKNGREMRAVLKLGDLEMATDWTQPNSYGNFVFHMPAAAKLPMLDRQQMAVEFVQDGGLGRRDRRFEGQVSFWPHSILSDRPGLVVVGEVAVGTWASDRSMGAPRVAVELPVFGAPLDKVAAPQFCTI